MCSETPQIVHIKENFYSQKVTCIAVLMRILYTFSLNPSLYCVIILNVWSVTSTSSGYFFAAQKDLIECRGTAGFSLLNMLVLTQQNTWKFGSENGSCKDLNLLQERMAKAICQGSWEETQVSQLCVSLSL